MRYDVECFAGTAEEPNVIDSRSGRIDEREDEMIPDERGERSDGESERSFGCVDGGHPWSDAVRSEFAKFHSENRWE